RRVAQLRAELHREELWCDLLGAREAAAKRRGQDFRRGEIHAQAVAATLVDVWKRFQSTQANADEFVSTLHCAWPPGRGARPSKSLCQAAHTQLPFCIEDCERRTAAQLAWLRMYPK
ncbi:unnamed protein product, partial [Effrenium voratum]